MILGNRNFCANLAFVFDEIVAFRINRYVIANSVQLFLDPVAQATGYEGQRVDFTVYHTSVKLV
jgi:hypothetical protein